MSGTFLHLFNKFLALVSRHPRRTALLSLGSLGITAVSVYLITHKRQAARYYKYFYLKYIHKRNGGKRRRKKNGTVNIGAIFGTPSPGYLPLFFTIKSICKNFALNFCRDGRGRDISQNSLLSTS